MYFWLFSSDPRVADLSMVTVYLFQAKNFLLDHGGKDLSFHPFSHCKQVDHTMIQWESPFEVEAVRRGHDVADSSTQVMGHH